MMYFGCILDACILDFGTYFNNIESYINFTLHVKKNIIYIYIYIYI